MDPVQPPVKRRYDTSRRRQAAERTRQAILTAALQLFTARGYTATPMTAIAEHAGVALDTVYASVGRKPELLLDLMIRVEDLGELPHGGCALRRRQVRRQRFRPRARRVDVEHQRLIE